MSQDPRIKQLKIKTGVVKRIAKEKVMYTNEAESLNTKVETMKASGKDEYDIKKQIEVYEESLAMIPDTKRRLQASINELQNILDNENDLHETEEGKAAIDALKNAKIELDK